MATDKHRPIRGGSCCRAGVATVGVRGCCRVLLCSQWTTQSSTHSQVRIQVEYNNLLLVLDRIDKSVRRVTVLSASA